MTGQYPQRKQTEKQVAFKAEQRRRQEAAKKNMNISYQKPKSTNKFR